MTARLATKGIEIVTLWDYVNKTEKSIAKHVPILAGHQLNVFIHGCLRTIRVENELLRVQVARPYRYLAHCIAYLLRHALVLSLEFFNLCV